MLRSFVIIALVLSGVHGAFADSDELVSGNATVASTCVCTTVPCPVSGTNKLTEGAGAIGTYIYATHSGHAVVTSASITITKSDLDHGSDTTSCTQEYSRSLDDDGVKDCDAGHILANRLGGAGNQPINIFPQDLGVNRGAYAQFENAIYDCTKAATSASLSWTFSYSSSTKTKPNKVHYSATFKGGSCATLASDFTN